jgi:Phycobilisome degradation protein nblA
MLGKSKCLFCQGNIIFLISYASDNLNPRHQFNLKGVKAMMPQSFDLSLEQQFSVRSFQTQIQEMSREQAQEFLVQIYTQMLWQESTYKNLLKHQWGIENCPGCS